MGVFIRRYLIARDGAYGRSSHVWAPDLVTSQQALATQGALITYGMVANLDHNEGKVPDFALFNETWVSLDGCLQTESSNLTPRG